MNFDQIIMTSIKLLAVVVLVFVNGFFVAAEFALVKLRRTQLDTLVAKGQRRALMALKLITHLDATLSATQLGITSASLALISGSIPWDGSSRIRKSKSCTSGKVAAMPATTAIARPSRSL